MADKSDEEILGSAIWSTGMEYEWKPGKSNQTRLESDLAYAKKAGDHYWTAIAMYHLSENSMRDMVNDQMHMDMENLMSVHMGCFICEEIYSPKLAKRRCKGEPKGELKYV